MHLTFEFDIQRRQLLSRSMQLRRLEAQRLPAGATAIATARSVTCSFKPAGKQMDTRRQLPAWPDAGRRPTGFLSMNPEPESDPVPDPELKPTCSWSYSLTGFWAYTTIGAPNVTDPPPMRRNVRQDCRGQRSLSHEMRSRPRTYGPALLTPYAVCCGR